MRFKYAVDEVVRLAPKRLLDYGTGDGFLIQQLHERLGSAMPSVVAYEPVLMYAPLLAEVVRRVSPSRVTVISDLDALGEEPFDAITCLSVLEHLYLPERQKFYHLCESHLLHEGRCLVEVPVEIGPTLLVKEAARRALKGRQPEYRLGDLARLGAGATAFDARRFDPTNDETFLMSHRGFDYRVFAKELERRFRILRRFSTPIPRLPPPLGNQEVFFLLAPINRAPRVGGRYVDRDPT